jgi:hypothetical protein
MISGHLDPDALDAMIRVWLAATPAPADRTAGDQAGPAAGRTPGDHDAPDRTADGHTATDWTADGRTGPAALAAATRDLTTAIPLGGEPFALPRWARRRLADTLLRYAADALSGPGGLASFLRTSLLPGTMATVSLPLDVGTATSTIPPWLRRAVISRDLHCAFPGCHQPPAACHVHHLVPRSDGGATALGNLALLCSFPISSRSTGGGGCWP